MPTWEGCNIAWYHRFWPPDPLKEVQRRKAQALLKIEEQKLAKLAAIAESPYWQDVGVLIDMFARFSPYDRAIAPIASSNDRLYGGNYPYYRTEQELAILRSMSRDVCIRTSAGAGLLNGLESFVLGEGATYQVTANANADGKLSSNDSDPVPDALLARGQAIIDEFMTRTVWHELEGEIFRRSRRDGEAFIRLFRVEQGLDVRLVEPEQVTMPKGGTPDEWSWGIRVDPDDQAGPPLAYNVRQIGTTEDEVVPADEILHIKVNVDRAVKRGMPDFAWEVRDVLRGGSKLLQNLRDGAAVQASYAVIRQHDTARKADVEAFTLDQMDFSLPTSTGGSIGVQKLEPGGIIDIPKNMSYVSPPAWTNSGGLLEIYQACMRGAAVRWNAPEWLASSDASNNNYASSLTAESPFVKTCKKWQRHYKELFKRVMIAVLQRAIQLGRLPDDYLTTCTVQIEMPRCETRDRLQEAQVFEIERRNGILSPQTWMMLVGRDPDHEMEQQEAWTERFGPLPGQDLATMLHPPGGAVDAGPYQ